MGWKFKKIDQNDGGSAGLFLVKSLKIGSSTKVTVKGGVPAIIYATDTIRIDGSISALPGYAQLSPGGFPQGDTGLGGGPGGGGGVLNYNGGGGGSFCGICGTGG